MSKMRIHELAKQIEKDSKDILKVLTDSGVDVKNHMSTLSDDNIDFVKNKLVQSNKTEEPKKSRITQVYNPQNSGVNKQQYNNRNTNNNNNRVYNNKTEQNKQTTNPINQSHTQVNKPEANQQQKPQVVDEYTYNGVKKPSVQRPAGQGYQQRPAGQSQGQRPAGQGYQQRPAGQTGQSQGQRPAGQGYQQRPAGQTGQSQGQRPAGQGYQQRPAGQTGQSQGQRPAGQGYQQRPAGQTGQSQGQRPAGQGYQQRSAGQTGQSQGQRPAGQGYQQRPAGQSQGQRPAGQSQGQRPAGQGYSQKPAGQGQRQGQGQGQKPGQGQQQKPYQQRGPQRPAGGQQRSNQRGPQRPQSAVAQKPKEEEVKVITIPEVLTIKELADKLKLVPSALVKKLFLQGKVVTINHEVNFETAEEIALEFNAMVEKEIKVDVIEELLKEDDENEALLKSRPPVVCVMGHVDHGKTSLLDAIRETNVISREAGGITQHIGAYVVEKNGEKITFLDTPGHEAFTAMRMRGAQSTDIAILVVAADDGVMPQTIEAINHAKAAEINIIVAINKIDKASANIDKVKQELSEYELVAEDWGGDTIFVPVSAHTKEGIESLLEMVLLTAEISELKANPNRNARGIVIEAQLDKGKGSVATVLVQKGTLRVGDHIAAGSCYGKVRAMMDDKGRRLKSAGPSTPVEILGLNSVPNAGDIFIATENDKEARSFAETFISEGREKLMEGTKARMSLDDLFTQIQAGDVKELNVVVKADVQGSVEAVKQSLMKLSNENVVVKIIHGGVGAINESDVILASASNAIIIGFNVRPDNTAKEIADREKVDLRLYRVIYKAIEDVEAAMKGLLDPVFREKVLGHAEVRQTFKASGIGTIAGSYVLDGIFKRDCSVRLTRDNIVIFDGPLQSLKRFKDDVKEVRTGYECGFVFEKFNDVKEGDLVEAYEMEEIPR